MFHIKKVDKLSLTVNKQSLDKSMTNCHAFSGRFTILLYFYPAAIAIYHGKVKKAVTLKIVLVNFTLLSMVKNTQV